MCGAKFSTLWVLLDFDWMVGLDLQKFNELSREQFKGPTSAFAGGEERLKNSAAMWRTICGSVLVVTPPSLASLVVYQLSSSAAFQRQTYASSVASLTTTYIRNHVYANGHCRLQQVATGGKRPRNTSEFKNG